MTDTDAEIAALKEATREAHEAIQGMKLARRDLLATMAEVREEINSRIEKCLVAELGNLTAAVQENIDLATAKVFQRFDTLADELLGEGWRHRKKGDPSLPDMLRDHAARGGLNRD
jgi:hypothetical protein